MPEIKNAAASSYRFYRFAADSLPEIFNVLNSDAHLANIAEDKPGFSEVCLQGHSCSFFYREIVPAEIVVLKDGKFKKETFYTVEDAFFTLFKTFAIVTGKPHPSKIGMFTVSKLVGVEFRGAHIAPKRLFEISDHMSRIKGIDFDKMQHPVYRKVKLDGVMETMADIAPFHGFVDNVKSIKGLMNTPEGVRTLKLTTDGRVSISKKKDEIFTEELLVWLFKLVYGSQEARATA